MTAGFKRLWRGPRRLGWGGLFDPPTARQRYLREQSQARYLRRPDSYPLEEQVLRGELGVIESFRFITLRKISHTLMQNTVVPDDGIYLMVPHPDFMRWLYFRKPAARSASARKRKAGRWHRVR